MSINNYEYYPTKENPCGGNQRHRERTETTERERIMAKLVVSERVIEEPDWNSTCNLSSTIVFPPLFLLLSHLIPFQFQLLYAFHAHKHVLFICPFSLNFFLLDISLKFTPRNGIFWIQPRRSHSPYILMLSSFCSLDLQSCWQLGIICFRFHLTKYHVFSWKNPSDSEAYGNAICLCLKHLRKGGLLGMRTCN